MFIDQLLAINNEKQEEIWPDILVKKIKFISIFDTFPVIISVMFPERRPEELILRTCDSSDSTGPKRRLVERWMSYRLMCSMMRLFLKFGE